MHSRYRVRQIVSAATLALLTSSIALNAEVPDRTPKLIVLIMVDQMRGDYVDKFRAQWSGGLHRIVSSGAWFRQADYPYFDTVTCAGHATVATGTLPWIHGMVMNSWWDRTRNVEVPCTEDRTVAPVSYGKAVKGFGDSAAPLRVSTLPDELRAQSGISPHVIGFSLKARAAIPLVGHRPDAVAWFDDSGTWVTSTAFAKAPVPAVADFIHRHPVEADFGKVWERTLPVSAYLYDDAAIGARPTAGLSPGFPHPLKGSSPTPDKVFYDQWQESPFSDEYIAEMALDVAARLRLGQGNAVDIMAVSFSALDKVGHDYGPNSHEVQDVLVRLNRTLGRMLAELDRSIGSDNYLVALTGDHGVAPMAEWATTHGIDGGRIAPETLEHTVQNVLSAAFGRGNYVAQVLNGNIYLAGDAFERLVARPQLLDSVRQALLRVPGVQMVAARGQLMGMVPPNAALRALARSYDPARSGDLFIVQAPYWTIRDKGTGHGSPYGFDTRVPVLLLGKGIEPGEYLDPVSPADIAPTLAFMAGVTLPQSEGRVLSEALSRVPRISNPSDTR